MTMQTPWWRNDDYWVKSRLATTAKAGGPEGLALVPVWPDGSTAPGWGLRKRHEPEKSGFMWKYQAGLFSPETVLPGVSKGRWDFAFVMRGMKALCIDIDGKNGGLVGAGQLGMLPPTLAEVSRSGNGYHLFYYTPEDDWDEEKGFALYSDRIGIAPGVDIRGTGCVYHYTEAQRWNSMPMAPLPNHLAKRLRKHETEKVLQIKEIKKLLEAEDPTDLLLMRAELEKSLQKPIPAGKRNTTIFAIGSQLMLAGVLDWQEQVELRALSVGLDPVEISKLTNNIKRYGGNA
jgi:hypothetical protein